MVIFLCAALAQAVTDLDGDGLYDIEDYAADNGIDLGSVTGAADYQSCGIEDLDGASDLVNATSLTLSGNAIAAIEPGDFSGLSNLTWLELDSNYITTIEPGDFDGLSQLQGLYLDGNGITTIEFGDFSGLSGLTTLRLTSNGLTLTEPGSFADMGNLQLLDLRYNMLSEVNLTAANLPSWTFSFGVDTSINDLILDRAILSGASFAGILAPDYALTDASLVGTDLGDTLSLSPLLDRDSLGTLTVDFSLYATWQSDLDTWDAASGHDLIVLSIGDFDRDGDVDADDIDLLCENIGGPAYDLDGDLDADEDDFVHLVENLVELQDGSGRVGTAMGDFNLDGLVNATDLAIMKAAFGTWPRGWADGNANCDDIIDATDLAILAANFGFEAPTGAVPEPTTLGLLALGGLALLKRRK